MYLHRGAHNFKRRQKNLILMPKYTIIIVKKTKHGVGLVSEILQRNPRGS